MSMPAPNSNVSAFPGPRDEQQVARDATTQGRTIARRLPEILKALLDRFKNDDGVLYIDHSVENIRNGFEGVPEFEGTMTLSHGLRIDNDFKAPKGKLKLPGQTVIIAEGANVSVNLECATLYNLGTLDGQFKVDLLVNYGTISGEIAYRAVEAAGIIDGKMTRIRE